MATLTPEAKKLLSQTIRGLRERLLRDIREGAERCYHLSVPVSEAGLDEVPRKNRERLEAWLDERVRAIGAGKGRDLDGQRERFLIEAVKQAGATLVNRVALLRCLEASGLSKPEVVTGGWNSKGYQEFHDFAPELIDDDTEGYLTLLHVVFDELAVDLPGLFGDVGLTRLFPVPPATLREVVNQLDDKDLESAWKDDTTLGWIYQYWNDPEREEIDARLDAQRKLEASEIASKTQMFTERYMVEWLLHNSLGFTWLCICRKNGWTPDAERVLPVLEARRVEWRKKRDAGEVALDALMPIATTEEDGGLEDAWKYYVPQPVPDDAVENAPASIRDLKLLDPACGSGHFLVIAFGLLARMYCEEGRHRGEDWSDEDIAEAILANNLNGVDIDPRAIQLAAAGLYLKAKTLSPRARLHHLNLVAPMLQLGDLPHDDPALAQLRAELKCDVGISEELTDRLVSSLAGVGHLGSVLKVDAAVEEALRAVDLEFERGAGQGDLFRGYAVQQVKLSVGEARATVLDKLEGFLAQRTSSEDLGLRLDGAQLAAGVRFTRMANEGTYDIIVGNPPYFGTQAIANADYIDTQYPDSKENLCTVLLDRSTQLCREGGLVAFVTVRNWLYVSQLAGFRSRMLRTFPPMRAADLGLGGFASLPGVEAVLWVARRSSVGECIVARAADAESSSKAGVLLGGAETYGTSPMLLARLPGSPFVYRWSRAFVEEYLTNPLLGEVAPVRVGMKTSDNLRFLRCPWELSPSAVRQAIETPHNAAWVPYVKGAQGKAWFEPLSDLVNWQDRGLEIRLALEAAYGQGPQGERHFFSPGVAFSTIGRAFVARAHRFPSIFDVAGSSVFPPDIASTVCLLNSRFAREIVEALNPTINFQVGDVGRIPFRPDPESATIFRHLEAAFSEREATDETSCRFRKPAASPWRSAQEWAQRAVDRPDGEPLPAYVPEYDPPEPESLVSFGVGVALGRFGADGKGILDEAPATALPAGVLYLSVEGNDSVDHPACSLLHTVCAEHGATGGKGDDVRTYLRTSFFGYHKKLYENRPIYFPLSSAKKSFVAFVSIHRWRSDTLQILLADYLMPAKRRLEGELEDIRKAPTERGNNKAERRFAEIRKLLDELGDFIEKITLVAEQGPPPADSHTPAREIGARFDMHLEDGVMVNSGALWPLLAPQWKDPRKWWLQLATRSGPKGTHFDWSRTAMRYFPNRVADECHRDPPLAAAHRCLWREHPSVAYGWELRLRDDRADFAIKEERADELRSRFLTDSADVARKVAAAVSRRKGRGARGRRGTALLTERRDD